MDEEPYMIINTRIGLYIVSHKFFKENIKDPTCDVIAEDLTWEEADALVKLAGQ